MGTIFNPHVGALAASFAYSLLLSLTRFRLKEQVIHIYASSHSLSVRVFIYVCRLRSLCIAI